MKSLFTDKYRLGFGTWNRSGDEAYKAVCDALTVGYRHIDTAQAYANEAEVGKAIAQSGIVRSELLITTKVDPVNFGPNCVKPSVEMSLDKLAVDNVDLLLLHFPSLFDEFEARDYIQQLADVQQQGLCKYIGVSNFTRHYLDIAIDILGAENIATNQVEIHAYMQNKTIVNYCRTQNISTTAYSPLARGQLLKNKQLQNIAVAHQATVAQIALAFLLTEGHVVIPSSSNIARATENFIANSIVLTPDDLDLIRGLDQGLRLIDEEWCPKWDK